MSSKKKIKALVIMIAVMIMVGIVTHIIITHVMRSKDGHRQLEFAQIEAQIQEDTASAAVIEFQSEEMKTTVITMPLENIPRSGKAASVQTRFVTQDGEQDRYQVMRRA